MANKKLKISKLRMYVKEMDKFDIDFSEIPEDMLTELYSY